MGRKINVKNRSAGNIVYTVPDLNVRRDFLPGEIKRIDEDELTQLSYSQGGRLLITQYLQILDEPAREEVNGPVEPEYNFSEEDIRDSYYVYFGYPNYVISHQNSTSPVYQKEGWINYHHYEFSIKYPIKKYGKSLNILIKADYLNLRRNTLLDLSSLEIFLF